MIEYSVRDRAVETVSHVSNIFGLDWRSALKICATGTSEDAGAYFVTSVAPEVAKYLRDNIDTMLAAGK